MNERDEPETGTEGDDFDAAVGRLLRLAGPRTAPPPAATARVQAAFLAQWRRTIRQRRRRVFFLLSGAALATASVFVAILARFPRPAPNAPSPGARVAVVAKVDGDPSGLWANDGPESSRRRLKRGDPLLADTALETGTASRLALQLAEGTSVRLDGETRLHLTSASVLTLERGALYVDRAAPPGSRPLEVVTPRGVARDMGTQFEVRVLAAEVRIRVREGSVRLSTEGQAYQAEAGEQLLTTQAGQVLRDSVPRHGPEWRWVLALAPGFTLEGASLDEFLSWNCRENGWTCRFSRAEDAVGARSIVLHGSIEELDPAHAIDAVLPATNFTPRFKDGILLLDRTPEAP